MGGNMLPLLVRLILAAVIADGATTTDNETSGGSTTLEKTGGAPTEFNQTLFPKSNLLFDEYYTNYITRLAREGTPERYVHAKGAGAFGYFLVTHDITSICKAKLFSEVGKTTPIAVRFSPTSSGRSGLDTGRESRGFAVKFYTEDGNFDIAGLNVPMFPIREPALFPLFVTATKMTPGTHLTDWSFLITLPETLYFHFLLFSDRGIPDGYRHMPGFGVHTFQVVNDQGENSFVRFHFSPDAGVKNLFSEQARTIGAVDANYATRDLYNAIENGNFPSWTMSVQVLSTEDVESASFDVFDVTKVLPLDKYPLREVGKLVLNRNPSNHFTQMELIAFSPGNLVPGIVGTPDMFLEARRLAYILHQKYRFSGNIHNIKVNRPVQKDNVCSRDNVELVSDNGSDNFDNYFKQASDFYTKEMAEDERNRFVQNILASLETAGTILQEVAVSLLRTIHPELGSRIEQGLKSHLFNEDNKSCNYIEEMFGRLFNNNKCFEALWCVLYSRLTSRLGGLSPIGIALATCIVCDAELH